MSDVFDPTKQTSPEFNRKVFVGLGAGAAAFGGSIAAALAQGEGLGKPHAPIVAEDDPAIVVERPTLTSSGASIPAYAAAPKGATAKTPGVVIVQHIWGVDAQIRDTVRRFAKEGYVTIAPELFARSGPVPSGDGLTDYTIFRAFAGKLDTQFVIADLASGAAWIRTRGKVGANDRPPKIGITGFCMGGGIVLGQAWRNPGPYDAAVMWYGSVRQEGPPAAEPLAESNLAYSDKVAIPVMGNFGGRDTGPPPSDVKALDARLKRVHDFKIYDEAGHAFFDDTRASYVASAASNGWMRTLAWFKKYLSA